MKIPQKLPQFEKEKYFVIVAGHQEADFYTVFEGNIDKKASFKFEKPKYSDKEGFTARATQGKSIGGGPALEISKEKITQDFLKEFKKIIRAFSNDKSIKKVVIFSSPYVISHIKDNLPVGLRDKVKKVISGNYSKTHPLKIVEMIFAR
ncbi:MAG: hypothetical protein WC705_03520 [Candidatus Paceibacterota bacterium]|jgi:hypothetical protein